MPGVANDFGITLVGTNAAFGVGNPDTTIYTTNRINDGAWHHIAATRDATSGQMNLYRDGVLQATTTGPTGTRAAPANLKIGALQTLVAGDYLAGTIDDVQIFSCVFAAGEMPSLMNHAPALQFIFDTGTPAGRVLNITNSASDVDLPAQTRTYSLPTAPVAASINAASGLVTWRPAATQAGATYPFSVRVADNGSPRMSATQMFSVAVASLAKPQLVSPALTNSAFQLRVTGANGPDYIIQVATNLAAPNSWSSVFTTNSPVLPFVWTDALTTNFPTRFYRVLLAP